MYRVHPMGPSLFFFRMWEGGFCCVGIRATQVPGYLLDLGLHSDCAGLVHNGRMAWDSWELRYLDRPGLDGAATGTVTSAPRKTPR